MLIMNCVVGDAWSLVFGVTGMRYYIVIAVVSLSVARIMCNGGARVLIRIHTPSSKDAKNAVTNT